MNARQCIWLLLVMNLATFVVGVMICYDIFNENNPSPYVATEMPLNSASEVLELPLINADSLILSPIFSRSRQEISIESLAVSAMPSAVPVVAPVVPTLAGVFKLEDGESWALLEQGGEHGFVTSGGSFTGWTVMKISEATVKLVHHETKVIVTANIPNIGLTP